MAAFSALIDAEPTMDAPYYVGFDIGDRVDGAIPAAT
jgi:hypothetical protein